MKDALVIKTGEILDIKFQYEKMVMSYSFDLYIDPKDCDEANYRAMKGVTTNEVWAKKNDSGDVEEGNYYVLSDGNKYYENELIVGLDHIREYKIKNIIK